MTNPQGPSLFDLFGVPQGPLTTQDNDAWPTAQPGVSASQQEAITNARESIGDAFGAARVGGLSEISYQLGVAANELAGVNTGPFEGLAGEAFRQSATELTAALSDLSDAADGYRKVAEDFEESLRVYRASSPGEHELADANANYQAVAGNLGVGKEMFINMKLESVAREDLQGLQRRRAEAVRQFALRQAELQAAANQVQVPTVAGVVQRHVNSSPLVLGPGGYRTPGGGVAVGGGMGGVNNPSLSASGTGTGSGSSGGSGSSSSGSSGTGGATSADLGTSLSDGQLGYTQPPSVAAAGQLPMNAGTVMPTGAMPFAPLVSPSAARGVGGPRTMGDAEFQNLLDKVKPDSGSSSAAPGAAGAAFLPGSSAGGAVAPSAAAQQQAAPAQPASWSNAQSAKTGESAASAARAAAAASQQQATPSTVGRGGMPMMPPMMPPGQQGNSQGQKDAEGRPTIKNADPTVFGDDVRVTDPVVGEHRKAGHD